MRVLTFRYPLPPESAWHGSDWSGNKVLWIVRGYAGTVLIRGRQLDGPNELRFGSAKAPAAQMVIQPGPSARENPSATRVRASGCYGYQVDGASFSTIVVFEARRA